MKYGTVFLCTRLLLATVVLRYNGTMIQSDRYEIHLDFENVGQQQEGNLCWTEICKRSMDTRRSLWKEYLSLQLEKHNWFNLHATSDYFMQIGKRSDIPS